MYRFLGFVHVCGMQIHACKSARSESTMISTHTYGKCRSGTTFVFRRYQHATDRDDVKHICANLFNSQDHVPRLLHAYAADTRCEPFVLEGPTGVAAFVLVRHKQFLFHNRVPLYREFFIEAVRVREDLRGVGLATTILSEATKLVRRMHGEASDLHILSTTIPENKAMTRVFDKAGWTAASHMIIWPKKDEIRYLENTGKPMLESLHVLRNVSPQAVALSSKWQKIGESEDIHALVLQLRGNTSQFLRPDYFAAEGLPCASLFLTNELSEQEERSAWRLDCDGRLLGLLFIRPYVFEPSSNIPPNTCSACIDDLYGAESAVLFAGNLLKNANFHVSFDSGMSAEKMNSSVLFSSVKFAHFIVYRNSE